MRSQIRRGTQCYEDTSWWIVRPLVYIQGAAVIRNACHFNSHTAVWAAVYRRRSVVIYPRAHVTAGIRYLMVCSDTPTFCTSRDGGTNDGFHHEMREVRKMVLALYLEPTARTHDKQAKGAPELPPIHSPQALLLRGLTPAHLHSKKFQRATFAFISHEVSKVDANARLIKSQY